MPQFKVYDHTGYPIGSKAGARIIEALTAEQALQLAKQLHIICPMVAPVIPAPMKITPHKWPEQNPAY